MSSINKLIIKKVLNLFLVFAIIICILALFRDYVNVNKYAGIDLRNRVVGARLLTRGLDPYYFKWNPGKDEELLDPLDNPKLPVSRVTVAPSILLLHSPLATLPYFQQKNIWFCIQWSALITSCLLLIKNYQKNLQEKFVLIIALIFIFGNNFWRLHIVVGQIYVLYPLLLSLAYCALDRQIKFKDIIAGCLIGYTASLRLPILVIILPMIIFKKFKLLTTTLLGFCLSLLACIAITGQQAWISYFSAMRTIGKLNIGIVEKLSNDNNNFIIPKMVENLSNFTLPPIPGSNSSIQTLLREVFHYSIQGNILIVICCIVLMIVVIFMYFTFNKKNIYHQQFNWDIFFICGGLLILIVDIFIPAPRYSYNNIQFLIPLLLILKNVNFSSDKGIICVCLLIVGLFFTSGIFSWIPKIITIGEYILIGTMVFMIAKPGFLTRFEKRGQKPDCLTDLSGRQ